MLSVASGIFALLFRCAAPFNAPGCMFDDERDSADQRTLAADLRQKARWRPAVRRVMRLLLRSGLPQRPAARCADGPVGGGNPAILRSRRHLAITLEFGIEIGQSSNLGQLFTGLPGQIAR